MFQAGPRRSGFHYCLWKKVRSDQSQLSPDNSLDRHWKGNAFLFPSFWSTSSGLGPRKARASSLASPAVPLFIKLTPMPCLIRTWIFPLRVSSGSPVFLIAWSRKPLEIHCRVTERVLPCQKHTDSQLRAETKFNILSWPSLHFTQN